MNSNDRNPLRYCSYKHRLKKISGAPSPLLRPEIPPLREVPHKDDPRRTKSLQQVLDIQKTKEEQATAFIWDPEAGPPDYEKILRPISIPAKRLEGVLRAGRVPNVYDPRRIKICERQEYTKTNIGPSTIVQNDYVPCFEEKCTVLMIDHSEWPKSTHSWVEHIPHERNVTRAVLDGDLVEDSCLLDADVLEIIYEDKKAAFDAKEAEDKSILDRDEECVVLDDGSEERKYQFGDDEIDEIPIVKPEKKPKFELDKKTVDVIDLRFNEDENDRPVITIKNEEERVIENYRSKKACVKTEIIILDLSDDEDNCSIIDREKIAVLPQKPEETRATTPKLNIQPFIESAGVNTECFKQNTVSESNAPRSVIALAKSCVSESESLNFSEKLDEIVIAKHNGTIKEQSNKRILVNIIPTEDCDLNYVENEVHQTSTSNDRSDEMFKESANSDANEMFQTLVSSENSVSNDRNFTIHIVAKVETKSYKLKSSDNGTQQQCVASDDCDIREQEISNNTVCENINFIQPKNSSDDLLQQKNKVEENCSLITDTGAKDQNGIFNKGANISEIGITKSTNDIFETGEEKLFPRKTSKTSLEAETNETPQLKENKFANIVNQEEENNDCSVSKNTNDLQNLNGCNEILRNLEVFSKNTIAVNSNIKKRKKRMSEENSLPLMVCKAKRRRENAVNSWTGFPTVSDSKTNYDHKLKFTKRNFEIVATRLMSKPYDRQTSKSFMRIIANIGCSKNYSFFKMLGRNLRNCIFTWSSVNYFLSTLHSVEISLLEELENLIKNNEAFWNKRNHYWLQQECTNFVEEVAESKNNTDKAVDELVNYSPVSSYRQNAEYEDLQEKENSIVETLPSFNFSFPKTSKINETIEGLQVNTICKLQISSKAESSLSTISNNKEKELRSNIVEFPKVKRKHSLPAVPVQQEFCNMKKSYASNSNNLPIKLILTKDRLNHSNWVSQSIKQTLSDTTSILGVSCTPNQIAKTIISKNTSTLEETKISQNKENCDLATDNSKVNIYDKKVPELELNDFQNHFNVVNKNNLENSLSPLLKSKIKKKHLNSKNTIGLGADTKENNAFKRHKFSHSDSYRKQIINININNTITSYSKSNSQEKSSEFKTLPSSHSSKESLSKADSHNRSNYEFYNNRICDVSENKSNFNSQCTSAQNNLLQNYPNDSNQLTAFRMSKNSCISSAVENINLSGKDSLDSPLQKVLLDNKSNNEPEGRIFKEVSNQDVKKINVNTIKETKSRKRLYQDIFGSDYEFSDEEEELNSEPKSHSPQKVGIAVKKTVCVDLKPTENTKCNIHQESSNNDCVSSDEEDNMVIVFSDSESNHGSENDDSQKVSNSVTKTEKENAEFVVEETKHINQELLNSNCDSEVKSIMLQNKPSSIEIKNNDSVEGKIVMKEDINFKSSKERESFNKNDTINPTKRLQKEVSTILPDKFTENKQDCKFVQSKKVEVKLINEVCSNENINSQHSLSETSINKANESFSVNNIEQKTETDSKASYKCFETEFIDINISTECKTTCINTESESNCELNNITSSFACNLKSATSSLENEEENIDLCNNSSNTLLNNINETKLSENKQGNVDEITTLNVSNSSGDNNEQLGANTVVSNENLEAGDFEFHFMFENNSQYDYDSDFDLNKTEKFDDEYIKCSNSTETRKESLQEQYKSKTIDIHEDIDNSSDEEVTFIKIVTNPKVDKEETNNLSNSNVIKTEEKIDVTLNEPLETANVIIHPEPLKDEIEKSRQQQSNVEIQINSKDADSASNNILLTYNDSVKESLLLTKTLQTSSPVTISNNEISVTDKEITTNIEESLLLTKTLHTTLSPVTISNNEISATDEEITTNIEESLSLTKTLQTSSPVTINNNEISATDEEITANIEESLLLTKTLQRTLSPVLTSNNEISVNDEQIHIGKESLQEQYKSKTTDIHEDIDNSSDEEVTFIKIVTNTKVDKEETNNLSNSNVIKTEEKIDVTLNEPLETANVIIHPKPLKDEIEKSRQQQSNAEIQINSKDADSASNNILPTYNDSVKESLLLTKTLQTSSPVTISNNEISVTDKEITINIEGSLLLTKTPHTTLSPVTISNNESSVTDKETTTNDEESILLTKTLQRISSPVSISNNEISVTDKQIHTTTCTSSVINFAAKEDHFDQNNIMNSPTIDSTTSVSKTWTRNINVDINDLTFLKKLNMHKEITAPDEINFTNSTLNEIHNEQKYLFDSLNDIMKQDAESLNTKYVENETNQDLIYVNEATNNENPRSLVIPLLSPQAKQSLNIHVDNKVDEINFNNLLKVRNIEELREKPSTQNQSSSAPTLLSQNSTTQMITDIQSNNVLRNTTNQSNHQVNVTTVNNSVQPKLSQPSTTQMTTDIQSNNVLINTNNQNHQVTVTTVNNSVQPKLGNSINEVIKILHNIPAMQLNNEKQTYCQLLPSQYIIQPNSNRNILESNSSKNTVQCSTTPTFITASSLFTNVFAKDNELQNNCINLNNEDSNLFKEIIANYVLPLFSYLPNLTADKWDEYKEAILDKNIQTQEIEFFRTTVISIINYLKYLFNSIQRLNSQDFNKITHKMIKELSIGDPSINIFKLCNCVRMYNYFKEAVRLDKTENRDLFSILTQEQKLLMDSQQKQYLKIWHKQHCTSLNNCKYCKEHNSSIDKNSVKLLQKNLTSKTTNTLEKKNC